MHETKNVMWADSQNRQLSPTKSLQNELEFFLQNCGNEQFLVRAGGNRLKNDKNTLPKMVNAWNKYPIHHSERCFARFSDSIFYLKIQVSFGAKRFGPSQPLPPHVSKLFCLFMPPKNLITPEPTPSSRICCYRTIFSLPIKTVRTHSTLPN